MLVGISLGLAALMVTTPSPGPSPIDVSDEIRQPLGRGLREARMLNMFEVFAPANYPFYANGRGDEGKVRFEVTINARGSVTDCTTTEEAEAETLNQPTCDLILAQARFDPARDRRGRAVASTFSRQVAWVLQHRPPMAVTDSHERVVLTFDGAGKVDCRIEASAGATVDPRTCAMVLKTPMTLSMANSQSVIARGITARYAVVSESSGFAGADAMARALQVGKREGEDLNDRTITRHMIDSSGKVTGCTIVEPGMVGVPFEDGKSMGDVSCARMATAPFVPSSTAEERILVQVSAAYDRAR